MPKGERPDHRLDESATDDREAPRGVGRGGAVAPFREAALGPTELALTRLAEMHRDPLRRACAWLVSYRVVSSAPVPRTVGSQAERAGLTSFGRAAEGIGSMGRKEIWVDAARTTQAHLSRIGYFFVTYFESGRCLITWDHEPSTSGSSRLVSRAPTGNGFEADYRSHAAAVDEMSAGDPPIVVTDLDVAVALGRHFYLYVVSSGTAATLVAIHVAVPVALIFAVVKIVMWLLGR